MKKTVKRKKIVNYTFLPVLICAIATAVYGFLFVLTDDTKAPDIQIDTDVLAVSVSADEAALLQGVTATDNADGDVTASILVEKISNLTEENTATITYAAFDAAGNVAKASRTLKYMDYRPPVFCQNKSLTLVANTTVDILSFMRAEDFIDGDISNRIKGTLVSNTGSLSTPGIHQVEFRVTNSMNDTEYITLPVEVYAAGTYNANVQLSDYLIYLQAGSVFNPADYLESLVVGTTSYSLKNQNPPVSNLTPEQIQSLGSDRTQEIRTYINRYVDPDDNWDPYVRIVNVEIKNDVITTMPGVYSVTYTVDYEGIYTGYARLNVVVEEET